jgi:hypothetical protein
MKHQCVWLTYLGRYLKLFFSDDLKNTRWCLMLPPESNAERQEQCLLEWVLFCPGCGGDFTSTTGSGTAGRPQMKKLLAEIKQ